MEEGSGQGSPVSVGSMALWNQRLAFAGTFERLGNVATWDGQVLTYLRCDLIADLAVWRGVLLAGGDFNSDVPCTYGSRILTWQDGVWTDFAGGVDLPPGECPPPFVYVNGILVANDEVVVSGSFSQVGGVPVCNVARYHESTWEPMGALDSGVSILLEAGGHLLAAAPGSPPCAIRCWDGVQWTAIGSNLDGSVRCLAAYGDRIVTAGEFTGHVAWFPVSGFEEAPNRRLHPPSRYAVRG